MRRVLAIALLMLAPAVAVAQGNVPTVPAATATVTRAYPELLPTGPGLRSSKKVACRSRQRSGDRSLTMAASRFGLKGGVHGRSEQSDSRPRGAHSYAVMI